MSFWGERGGGGEGGMRKRDWAPAFRFRLDQKYNRPMMKGVMMNVVRLPLAMLLLPIVTMLLRTLMTMWTRADAVLNDIVTLTMASVMAVVLTVAAVPSSRQSNLDVSKQKSLRPQAYSLRSQAYVPNSFSYSSDHYQVLQVPVKYRIS